MIDVEDFLLYNTIVQAVKAERLAPVDHRMRKLVLSFMNNHLANLAKGRDRCGKRRKKYSQYPDIFPRQ